MNETTRKFLAEHAQALSSDRDLAEPSPDESDSATLHGILLGQTGERIVLGHLGVRLNVAVADVIDITGSGEAIPNPFGRGVACAVVVRGAAIVQQIKTWKARDLDRARPFALAQPSLANDINLPERYSPKEIAWREAHAVGSPHMTTSYTTNWTDSQSPKWSGTNCDRNGGRVQDDGQSDEYYSDDSKNDGSSADDE